MLRREDERNIVHKQVYTIMRWRSPGLLNIISITFIISLLVLLQYKIHLYLPNAPRQDLNNAKLESHSSSLTNEALVSSTCIQTEVDYLESLLKNHTRKLKGNLKKNLARMINRANKGNPNGPILRIGAEVGVFKGDLSLEILKTVLDITTYYLVDPWRHLDSWKMPYNDNTDADFEVIYNEAMAKTRKNEVFGHKVKVIRDTTSVARHSIEDGSLDFVYIDGDHTAKGAMLDLIAWIPKVRCGGLVLGDDYIDSLDFWGKGVGKYDPIYVKSAVDAVAAGLEVKLFNLGRNNWAFVKQKDYYL